MNSVNAWAQLLLVRAGSAKRGRDGWVQTAEVGREAFPTDKIYGETSSPELRILSCGGEYDEETRQYADNVIVYARLG